MKFQGI